jgi:hypothetical protein
MVLNKNPRKWKKQICKFPIHCQNSYRKRHANIQFKIKFILIIDREW